MNIEILTVKYNGESFGLLGNPVEHKQHPSQQAGLDLYIRVINFDTGEECFKKLYENTKGLHFKHTGYSPMYLSDFIHMAVYIPYQMFTIEAE